MSCRHRLLVMLLVLKLPDRCVAFLRRRARQPTPTLATWPPSNRHTIINRCLSVTAFVAGIFAIVGVVYAAQSPHWIYMEIQSRACGEVRAPADSQALPRLPTDVRESSVVPASGTQDMSSKTSRYAMRNQLSRCTTGNVYVGPWTICAVYDSQVYKCGKKVM